MFTYIASHNLGATRFDAANLAELILDMGTAHGLDGPTPEEFRQITHWALDATPGTMLQWRRGWVFRIDADKPVTEVQP